MGKLVGHLLRSTEGGTPIHNVSAKECKGKCDQQRNRPAGRRREKPKAPVVEMMELHSVKFMKQKRGGG